MKKYVVLLMSLLSFCMSSWGISGQAMAEEPIKLLAGHIGSKDVFLGPVFTHWAEKLEKKSNGRIKVEHSWNSALGPPPAYYRMLVSGIMDVTMVAAFMAPGRLPITEIASLPWKHDSIIVGTKAAIELYKKGFYDKEMSDVKLLWTYAGKADPLSTSVPIKSLKDMKGTKIIAPSDTMSKLIRALGGTTLFLNPMDSYAAFQRGVATGVVQAWTSGVGFKSYEVLPYAIEPGFGTQCFQIAMNKDYYNNLPTDLQSVIDDMFVEMSLWVAEYTEQVDAQSRDVFLQHGVQISQWSEEDQIEIGRRFKPIWEDSIAMWEKRGNKNMRQAIDIYWNSLKAQGIEDPAWGYTPIR